MGNESHSWYSWNVKYGETKLAGICCHLTPSSPITFLSNTTNHSFKGEREREMERGGRLSAGLRGSSKGQLLATFLRAFKVLAPTQLQQPYPISSTKLFSCLGY